MGDARQKWIVKAVAQAFDVPNLAVEECLREHSTQALLTGFLINLRRRAHAHHSRKFGSLTF